MTCGPGNVQNIKRRFIGKDISPKCVVMANVLHTYNPNFYKGTMLVLSECERQFAPHPTCFGHVVVILFVP